MRKFKDTKRLVIHITPCRGETEGRVLSPLKEKQSEKWFLLRNRRIFASLPPGQVVPLDEKEVQLDMRTLAPEGAIHHRCWHCNDFYSHATAKM
jgi:hypothetical protein